MKISDNSQFEYDCQDAQELLSLLVTCSDDLATVEQDEVFQHLSVCPSCRQDYEDMKLAGDMLRLNRDFLRESGVFDNVSKYLPNVELASQELATLRFEAMMDRSKTRRKRRQHSERIAMLKSISKPVSAVAACIIAVFGLYLTVNYLIGNENTAPNLAVIPTENSVKIEKITGSGSEIIQPGSPIIAENTLKALKINGNRRMILNTGTELSIEPHNLGCIVILEKGEIFAEVQHDGKPFVVETIHGRAIITGTTFNIKADDKQMQLVVTEGTVRLEGEKGSVNVTADHKSTLASNSKPTTPQPCDSAKLTAWATGLEALQEFVAKNQSEIYLGSIFDSGPVDLDRIDYKSWIEQKRPWFKRQFPHIFKFKEALAKEGIDADYPDLLIKSGGLWRFAFPQQSRTRLIPANHESILKLASIYDKDSKWLTDNLQINPTAIDLESQPSTLKALEKWAKALNETIDSKLEISPELLLNSLHASIYLSETRTLTWLAVNNDQIELAAIEKQKAENLLEQQIKAANNCTTKFKQMLAETISSSTCDEDIQRQSLQIVIINVEIIMETENGLKKS